MFDFEKRAVLYPSILKVLKEITEANDLIEEWIIFIESGKFLEDIGYTSRGDIKDTQFFNEKKQMFDLIKILNKEFSQRVWNILYAKLKLMLPKEISSYGYPCPTGRSYGHDNIVKFNLRNVIFKDLQHTEEKIKEIIEENKLPNSKAEMEEILNLLPKEIKAPSLY